MLCYFKKGKNAKKKKKICAVYAEGAVTDRTCQRQFANFCARDFSLDDAPWVGRPVANNQIETLIENSQHYTTWERANILNIQINKVIGENEKCVFYFMEKTK